MEKTYFNSLDAITKTELAWNYGEMVAGFELEDKYVSLYVLAAFFVEMHINKYTNELELIRLQDDRDVLLAYLSNLDLSPLLSSIL